MALMFFELVLKSSSFNEVYRRGSLNGSLIIVRLPQFSIVLNNTVH